MGPLAPLREELNLSPGPYADDGSPTWVIDDPAVNRFFRVGFREFEILSRWGMDSVQALAEQVNRETALQVSEEEVEALANQLNRHHLLRPLDDRELGRLLSEAHQGQHKGLSFLVHRYLFFRLPLLRPDRLLSRLLPWLSWLFAPSFWWLVAAMACAGLLLVLRQWEGFTTTFIAYMDFWGVLGMGVSLVLVKVVHELGHALTAKYYGCRVPTMGVAFLVLWPVLYTETSDAWRLPEKRPRLLIGAAGMLAELALAAAATLLWHVLDDGLWRAIVFLLASTTWMVTLLVNLNPLMRFDGYFLLSDWLGVANLQERAFRLARWQAREVLFAWGEDPPERWPPGRAWVLIAFAWAVWIYRLLLFVGIALMVYHLFFKLLGMALFVVEITWFIVLPLASEGRVWWLRRKRFSFNGNLLLTGSVLLLALFLLGYPWRQSIPLPALMDNGRQVRLYTPMEVRVGEIRVVQGQQVAEGEVLLRLDSPDLQDRLARNGLALAGIGERLAMARVDDGATQELPLLIQRLAALQAERESLLEEEGRLIITAPWAGRVVWLDVSIQAGDWLADKVPLLLLHGGGVRVTGYVAEGDLGRLRQGMAGRFIPDDLARRFHDCPVQEVAGLHAAVLEEGALGSVYGGVLPVRVDPDGRLVPEGAYYRVRCWSAAGEVERVLRGVWVVQGDRESVLARGWRAGVAVIRRESGF